MSTPTPNTLQDGTKNVGQHRLVTRWSVAISTDATGREILAAA